MSFRKGDKITLKAPLKNRGHPYFNRIYEVSDVYVDKYTHEIRIEYPHMVAWTQAKFFRKV